MPNWCENTLEIHGSKEDVKKFITDFWDEKEKSFCMNKILPIPDVLVNTSSPNYGERFSYDYKERPLIFDDFITLEELYNKEIAFEEFLIGKYLGEDGDAVLLSINNVDVKLKKADNFQIKKYLFKDNLCAIVCTKIMDDIFVNALYSESHLSFSLIERSNLNYAGLSEEVRKDYEVLEEEEFNYITNELLPLYKNKEYKSFIPLKYKDTTVDIPYNYGLFIKILRKCKCFTGWSSWYEWCCDTWGTKWDIDCECDLEDTYDGLYYNTAWSPNIEFFVNISPKYPNLTFIIYYLEEGVGFTGKGAIENGNYREINYYSSDEPLEYYSALINEFGDDRLLEVLFEYGISDAKLLNAICDKFEVDDKTRQECLKNIETSA